MPNPQYELLRSSISNSDCLKAFDLLQQHIGYDNRTTIEAIAKHLYGETWDAKKKAYAVSDGAIRKARDVVELLRTTYGIPVCSSSGKAGRWLASSEAEKRECLADFYSRRQSIDDVIHALERATVPPPKQLTKAVEAVQIGFF